MIVRVATGKLVVGLSMMVEVVMMFGFFTIESYF